MNKNNVFGVGILLIILMIIGGLLVKVFVLDKNKVDDKKDDTIVQDNGEKKVSLEKDGFQLNAEYKEENRWEYTISGTKPSPCHEIKHESLVQESYPEQVSVNLYITAPAPDVNCIQVIEELNVSGTFSASPEASVAFTVSKQ